MKITYITTLILLLEYAHVLRTYYLIKDIHYMKVKVIDRRSVFQKINITSIKKNLSKLFGLPCTALNYDKMSYKKTKINVVHFKKNEVMFIFLYN